MLFLFSGCYSFEISNSGSYQKPVGNDIVCGLSKPSVSKILKEVIYCMNTVLFPKYVKFTTDAAEKALIKDWYYFL